jgi:ubiquitin carboxyl-terminal hydrolase 9/13
MRTPAETLNSPPRVSIQAVPAGAAGTGTAPPNMARVAATNAAVDPKRKVSPAPTAPGQPGQRPEDKPDSPEYKKKQAMLAGPILSMNYQNAKSYGMTASVYTSLKDIFEALVAHKSRTGVVSPHQFLEMVKNVNESFRSTIHQDAHEFLNLVLNEVVSSVENSSAVKALHQSESANSLNYSPTSTPPTTSPSSGTRSPVNTGWVHELFEGTLTSETKCLTCENLSQRDEVFLDLSVDLDEHTSVSSCLRKFSEEEMLCERNKFHCDNCGGLQEAEKRMKIKRLPRILALHLKRFKYLEEEEKFQKLFHRVVYPYYLRLFNTTDDAEDPDRLYELYAVVVHIGSTPNHGHYVAIVKTQDRGWLLFDDEMVEPVDKSFVRNFFGDKPGQACAYVLFYQETTLDAVRREQEAEGSMSINHESNLLKDGTSNVKQNGHVGNGQLNQIQTVVPPLPEDQEMFAALNHSISAPAKSPINASGVSTLSPKKSDVQSKKERAKEEKEQKLAEKEREKTEKKRLKEAEVRRKELMKKQDDDMKAAIAASKASKAEEDKKQSLEGDKKKEEDGHSPGIGGTLNRFKPGNVSMSRKSFPRLSGWHHKGKDEPRESKEMPPDDVAVDAATGENQSLIHPSGKHEKPKGHRFSLKKKTSALLF